jgi:hypothetical protein
MMVRRWEVKKTGALMNRNRRGLTLLELLLLVIMGAVAVNILMMLWGGHGSRERARRAMCAMNLGGIGKGISLYQDDYREKFPALANPAKLTQGAIAEAPEMVAIADPSDESAFLDGDVKGNGSVNAYYLLVLKGYVEEDGFRCPSDESYYPGGEGTDTDRKYDLGFDGWKNLSYALQPTSLDAAAFSSRPGNDSKGEMALASDQVLDARQTPTAGGVLPERNNTINHGYEYANVLLMNGSVLKKERQEGADSTASKWGYEGDEIFTKTQSADPVERANDSILMGKEGGK